MARKEPTDEYGRALDTHLEASDALQRATLRNDVTFESARLANRRRESSRLAAKYDDDKAVIARAAAAERAQELRLAAARESADRTFVERIEPPADRGVVHGIARAGKPEALEVVALGDRDRLLAKTHPDHRGYWRLDLSVENANPKLAVVGGAAGTMQVRIAVRAAERELYRDKAAFPVRPGRVQYREIGVDGR